MTDAMKALKWIMATLFLLTVAAGIILAVYLGLPDSFARQRHFNRLVEDSDYAALVRAAVPVIQATKSQTIFGGDTIDDLPAVIATMKPAYVVVEPSHMKIEFHGGFDHFGFMVHQHTNAWELTRYGEGCEISLFKQNTSALDSGVR